MYTETGLMFPYFHSFPQEIQQLEDFSCTLIRNASMGSIVSDYDLGVDGDLFKAPEPIIEEPVISIDPMTAAISMISSEGESIGPQEFKVPDMESSADFEQLLSDVFYDCKKDILAKEENAQPLYEVLDVDVPLMNTDENLIHENSVFSQGLLYKSFSSGCLSSMERVPGTTQPPNFLDFDDMDLGTGMRRVFSEGDLETLGNVNINHISALEQQQIIISCSSEERMEKLLRYRNKKAKRNFGRKIKYACRKALADSQPRVRGRFAKTEEMHGSKKQ